MINAETPSPVAPIIVSMGHTVQQLQRAMEPQLLPSRMHHPMEYLDDSPHSFHPHPVELMETAAPSEYPRRDNSPISVTVDTEV